MYSYCPRVVSVKTYYSTPSVAYIFVAFPIICITSCCSLKILHLEHFLISVVLNRPPHNTSTYLLPDVHHSDIRMVVSNQILTIMTFSSFLCLRGVFRLNCCPYCRHDQCTIFVSVQGLSNDLVRTVNDFSTIPKST